MVAGSTSMEKMPAGRAPMLYAPVASVVAVSVRSSAVASCPATPAQVSRTVADARLAGVLDTVAIAVVPHKVAGMAGAHKPEGAGRVLLPGGQGDGAGQGPGGGGVGAAQGGAVDVEVEAPSGQAGELVVAAAVG